MKVHDKYNHVGQFSEMITNLDKFPEGLRVLAVDDDPVCLKLVQYVLLQCHYKVTITNKAVNALKILRENKNNFDIVLTDVHMFDKDGFRLLEIICLEMDIPVIMMPSNDDKATMMKCIEYGACDYLLKPIRLDVIKNIWQHVIRKSKFDNNDLNIGKGTIKMIVSKGKKRPNSQINGKDLKEDESNVHYDKNGSTQKKPRVAWHQELHKKFIHACDKLGPDKLVPSKILEEMNEPNLTRENIVSHLQKFRTALKKTGGQQKNNCIGSNGLISSQMNVFGHHVQKLDAFSHSFSSRTNLRNGVMGLFSSRMYGYNASNEPRPSSLPLPRRTSNSFPVNSSFDFGDYYTFDDANLSNTSLPYQNYSEIETVQETLPGLHEEIGLVHMDMQNPNVKYPIRLEELPWGIDSFDQLDTHSFITSAHSCSSIDDDDLNAVVKQLESMTMLKQKIKGILPGSKL